MCGPRCKSDGRIVELLGSQRLYPVLVSRGEEEGRLLYQARHSRRVRLRDLISRRQKDRSGRQGATLCL